MQTAEKISITMTPEALAAIRESVEAGEYASTSEAIRDAVRLWQRDREEHQATLASIKARIQASIDDPRPRLSIEEVQDRMQKRYEEMAKSYNDETI
jgi:antitoxin ParD1/3/4